MATRIAFRTACRVDPLQSRSGSARLHSTYTYVYAYMQSTGRPCHAMVEGSLVTALIGCPSTQGPSPAVVGRAGSALPIQLHSSNVNSVPHYGDRVTIGRATAVRGLHAARSSSDATGGALKSASSNPARDPGSGLAQKEGVNVQPGPFFPSRGRPPIRFV